jgi:hypothetical protein
MLASVALPYGRASDTRPDGRGYFLTALRALDLKGSASTSASREKFLTAQNQTFSLLALIEGNGLTPVQVTLPAHWRPSQI